MQVSPVLIILDDLNCDKHIKSNCNNERPERTQTLREMAYSLSKSNDKILVIQNKRKATKEELLLTHNLKMIEKVENMCANGGGKISSDVYVCENSFDSAISAVGCVLEAVDMIKDGVRIFCNVRPPGHHASSSKSSGYCVFNNVAVGVSYALNSRKFSRVAIIDWDVHHGNGTENIFADNPNVFYGSIHQSPFYPFTGKQSNSSKNKWNFNLPKNSKFASYQKTFEDLLKLVSSFQPELIFISCGFDAHKDDTIGEFHLLSEDYFELTKMVTKICPKIISVLEGGYNLKALRTSFREHVYGLIK